MCVNCPSFWAVFHIARHEAGGVLPSPFDAQRLRPRLNPVGATQRAAQPLGYKTRYEPVKIFLVLRPLVPYHTHAG